ncbi:MAG: type II toxin-antitoxin system PemK/MazF family toxin [Candidatus Thorarchaeota archaeon]
MTSGLSLQPGQVVWAQLGPAVGHEQEGKRPCIVISAPHKTIRGNKSLDIAIIVPLTRRERMWWTVVKVEPCRAVPQLSFALCHNVQAISTERILDKSLEPLDERTFAKVRVTLKKVLGL